MILRKNSQDLLNIFYMCKKIPLLLWHISHFFIPLPLVEEGEGVVIANARDSEYIGRFLVINGFKELKTSVDVSGCDLFCRRL